MNIQNELFDLEKLEADKLKFIKNSRSGTFADNMKLPIHRWFRYSAGFSAEWVESLINEKTRDSLFTILDPFAGSGTTLIAAEKSGVISYGLESHPFVAKIAGTKLLWNEVCEIDFKNTALELLEIAKQNTSRSILKIASAAPLLKKCYTEEHLLELFALKESFEENFVENPSYELTWLLITSILRVCSHAGTAQWQYVLPNKTKSKTLAPFQAYYAKVNQMVEDIQYAKLHMKSSATLLIHDSRKIPEIAPNSVDLVITSPPYPNNYDYADATRLEMTFWGEIKGWGDLNDAVRKFIIRSCSQHSAADKINLSHILQEEPLTPIREELTLVCNQLAEIRLTKGGKKTYHTMVAAYFLDLALVFRMLRRVCKPGSSICFVIGDSAPYGIYVPVDKWLGALALNEGFKSFNFEKLRDRNIKWKNRKHRVPLQEGRLWIEG